MTLALASLLTALLPVTAGTPPGGPAPAAAPAARAVQAAPAPHVIASNEELAALCAALSPAERVRAAGDALARGEAAARQRTGRAGALAARYAVKIPGAPLAFAPYDVAEGTLALDEPALLPVPGGGSSIWPTDERGLAVEVDPAGARRILEAQRAGHLALELVFDLPDDATCGADPRGKTFTLPVEPVDWRWSDGEAPLARGGAGAEHPVASLAQGARPRVTVEPPVQGPPDARRAVAARQAALERCYAEALRDDPSVDGLVVVALGPRPAMAADSTGAPALTDCVLRAVGAARPAGAAVPIRFELEPPAVAVKEGGR